MTDAPALEAIGIGKRFRTRGPENEETASVLAVDAVDFAVNPTEIVGLLGGNGAGKTTTIAMALGLVTPSVGKIMAFGNDMAKPRSRAAALRWMNFSSPYVEMPHRLTVRENLEVQARLYGVGQPRATAEATADAFELTAFLDRPAGKLSAGQKTRVALAKALINSPRLLLLDEPTASLDPDTGDWVRGRIEDYARATGAAVLLASHNMAEVERMCGRVLMMKAGRIVETGAPAALIARFGRANLEEVFLDVARDRAVGSAS